jgi:hypothetical protein
MSKKKDKTVLNLEPETSLDDTSYAEKEIAEWMKKKAETEQKRLEELKAKVIVVGVKNTGTLRKEKGLFNRLELKTNFDFSKVVDILISPTEESIKPGFSYVNVILTTKSPVCMLLPYLFENNTENNLKHWTFVNNSLNQTSFSIE